MSEDQKLHALIRAADAYILALRQVVYSGRPRVRQAAASRLNELGENWRIIRDDYPEVPPPEKWPEAL